jgi:chemotaxis protein MotB
MAATHPPIIIKRKAKRHQAHGGAWKVAYADFVTAMMALFIVLWLLSSSEKIQKTVGGYFQDPHGAGKQVGTDRFGSGEGLPLTRDQMPKLRQRLEQAMKKMNDFQRIHQQVQMTITPEGLRIELIETQRGFFFENGSAAATSEAKELLSALGHEISQVPNHLLIEGHTDAAPYAAKDGYSNWELSADRANAARRLMKAAGVSDEQVSYIRGFADRKLRNLSNPVDPVNRRVSLVVEYQEVGNNTPLRAAASK